MPNLLAQRVEETLRPVIGTVLAAVSVDVESKRIGKTPETLERADDITQDCPDNLAEVGARYAEAAPRYGMEFFLDI